jgi:arginine-tRNA-protein transferase
MNEILTIPDYYDQIRYEDVPFVREAYRQSLDVFLEEGWMLYGNYYYLRSIRDWTPLKCGLIPLRIRLEGFKFSKSQNICFKKHADLTTIIQPIHVTPAKAQLFDKHKSKFPDGGSDTDIHYFLNTTAHKTPAEGMEVNVFDAKKLIACGFFHMGEVGVNATYGIHDTTYKDRSLGAYTLLCEIDYSIKRNKKFYYLGWMLSIPSVFDYKKRFNNLEYFDWGRLEWCEMARLTTDTRVKPF